MAAARRPARRLYHRLVRAAQQARSRYDAAALARAEITTAQAAALFALEATPGQTQRQLARALDVREPSITQMLGRLEDRGLVARQAAEDSRAWSVVLTSKGRGALRRLRPVLGEQNAWLEGSFSEAELDVVARFLEAVASGGEDGVGPADP